MSSQASAVHGVADHRERNFYLGMGLTCVLIVVIGFARTYFLSSFLERPAYAPPLSIYVHLHAGIFTAWLVLFILQTAFVRADRRDLHRRLGILGLVIAIALVTINFATVVNAIDAGRTSTIGPPITRLYIALSASLIAASYIFAGLYWRRNRETHKRLMLVATIGMMGAPMNRFARQLDLSALLGLDRGTISFLAMFTLFGVCMLNDYRRGGRVHPVYIVGAVVLVASRALTGVVSRTDAWQTLAGWILG